MLRLLTSGWRDSDSGYNILLAHLKDEIVRAGFRVEEFEIKRRKQSEINAEDGTLDGDLQVVQRFMNRRPIHDSIHAMAVLLKRSAWADEDNTKRRRKAAQEQSALSVSDRRKIAVQAEADAAAHKRGSKKLRAKNALAGKGK